MSVCLSVYLSVSLCACVCMRVRDGYTKPLHGSNSVSACVMVTMTTVPLSMFVCV